MARTSSEEYWRQREEEQRRHNISDEREIQKQLQQIYQSMMDEITKEINGFYGKYAKQEGITMTEAMKRAEKLDIEEYARKAKKYVAEAARERRAPGSTDKGFFSEQANKEMSLYNMTMKVNRLELLKSSIGLEMVRGFDEITQVMDGALYDRATAELARQAGILGKTVQDNAKWARSIVNASFHHARFSDRIWAAQDVLKAELAKELSTGIIQGRHPRVLAANIRKRMGVSQSDAERLMRTELARVQTEAQKVSFQENGYDEYEFIALGSTACEHCAAINGKHFKVKDMQIGRNAPPVHPNCRCSTAAWMDRDSYDAWLNAKAAGETGVGLEVQNDGEKRKNPEPLSRAYVNHKDQLYKNLQNVKPIKGYEDFGVHGVPEESMIEYETTNGVLTRYTAKEFAEILRNEPTYRGGNIRLLSCGAGSRKSEFAQELANELRVIVLAPTETLWTSEGGDLFISDSDILAQMWYNDGEIDHSIKSTGEFKEFSPK